MEQFGSAMPQRFGMADNRRISWKVPRPGDCCPSIPSPAGSPRTLRTYFANGVALAPNDEYVLVNETGLGQIQRLWLKESEQGRSICLSVNYQCDRQSLV